MVGEDHVAVVMNARMHLSELAEVGARSETWRTTRSARLHRARLLRSYLTQPFYVSEAFSGRAGISTTAAMPSQIARPSLLEATTNSIRRRCIYAVVHRSPERCPCPRL